MLFVDDEKRWREGLELIGHERVEELLRRYPGLPQDTVTDLPVHAPFPTREFCRQWCLAHSSRQSRSYTSAFLAVALMALIAICYASCALSSL